MVDNRFLLNQEKIKKLKMSLAKHEQGPSATLVDHLDPQVPLENQSVQPAEVSEEEENEEITKWDEMEEVVKLYLSNPKSVKELTSLDLNELQLLAEECENHISLTTWRGEP